MGDYFAVAVPGTEVTWRDVSCWSVLEVLADVVMILDDFLLWCEIGHGPPDNLIWCQREDA